MIALFKERGDRYSREEGKLLFCFLLFFLSRKTVLAQEQLVMRKSAMKTRWLLTTRGRRF